MSEFEFNRDDERRHEIIGIGIRPGYDIVHFSGLTAEQAQTLLAERFADGDDAQNDAPSFAEIVQFLESNPSFRAHGYAVTPSRSDYRVTLEGVESATGCKPTKKEIEAYIDFGRHADEFDFDLKTGNCRAWWD